MVAFTSGPGVGYESDGMQDLEVLFNSRHERRYEQPPSARVRETPMAGAFPRPFVPAAR